MPHSELPAVTARADELFREHQHRIYARTDQLFVALMVIQWMGGVLAAHLISPLAWAGTISATHIHMWAAVVLGGIITAFPVFLGVTRPGAASTRHTIAVAQMLMSALLIHLTGGRIETHFHVFGSLAFLAFYRDVTVFIPATIVVAADHFLRGLYWPESAYGVTVATWRWLEHAAWVGFEDLFLVISCRQSMREMRDIATQRAELELTHEKTERVVWMRTAELAASEERFRTLTAASPIGIFEADVDGRATYLNPRWGEIAGIAPEDALGDKWLRAVHPDDRNALLAHWNTADRDVGGISTDFRMCTPAGDVRWVHALTKPVRSANGQVFAYVGTVEDFTERKRVEAAHAEEARTAAALARVGHELISSLATPIVLERLCHVTASALGCEYSTTWMYRAEDDVYLPISTHGLDTEDWDALRTVRLSPAAFASVHAQLRAGELISLTPDEPRHPFLGAMLARHRASLAVCIPLRNCDELIGLQVAGYRTPNAARDFRDTRIALGIGQLGSMALTNARLVDELEEASRLKSDFVSTMSHELRTPLNVVLGYTEMLEDDPDEAERRRLLTKVRRTSLELLEMVEATLDISRISAGTDAPRPESVVAEELWEELRTEFITLARRRDVTVRWESPDGAVLHTDRRKLKTILKNLVGNALKFTARGEIVVTCDVTESAFQLRIRDTGIGIAPEHLPVIFDMFRQVDSSDSRSYGGAGLGLYIVRTLATQLEGAVDVESEPGVGSTFRVTLPMCLPAQSCVAPVRAA